MPKLKSHSGAAKRFSKRGNGQIKFKQASTRHLLTKKSTKRKRQLKSIGIVCLADKSKVIKLLN
jgi:large subunit ribosomal protein L35